MSEALGVPDATASAPLQGVVVLDLGQIYCGPYCGFLLARLGAEVIKVEPPSGELTRHRSAPGVEPVALTLLNTNKAGIRLDLKTAEGKAILRSLVARADILVETFAAGVMERLGVGYDELKLVNPRLIYASATGFGREGPYSKMSAMDLTVQAMTGVLDSNGFAEAPPVKAGVAVADFAGGTHLAAGIMAALFQRTTTGLGQRVEVSMQDAVLPYLTSNISGYLTAGPSHPARTGNQHGSLSVSPYNVYPAADGFVAILCAADRHWRRLCDLMGCHDLANDPRFVAMTARAQHNDEVDVLVTSWAQTMAPATRYHPNLGSHARRPEARGAPGGPGSHSRRSANREGSRFGSPLREQCEKEPASPPVAGGQNGEDLLVDQGSRNLAGPFGTAIGWCDSTTARRTWRPDHRSPTVERARPVHVPVRA